jgi:hypothetical protein
MWKRVIEPALKNVDLATKYDFVEIKIPRADKHFRPQLWSASTLAQRPTYDTLARTLGRNAFDPGYFG